MAGGAGAAGERTGALRVASFDPVVVAGSRFATRESVVVRLSTESDLARRTVRASTRGTFTVRFTAVTVDRCNGGLSVSARGARGTFATAKVPPLPLCPPSLAPPR
jgi:hypothetical protein